MIDAVAKFEPPDRGRHARGVRTFSKRNAPARERLVFNSERQPRSVRDYPLWASWDYERGLVILGHEKVRCHLRRMQRRLPPSCSKFREADDGEYRCQLCDHVLEVLDGSTEVSHPTHGLPERTSAQKPAAVGGLVHLVTPLAISIRGSLAK